MSVNVTSQAKDNKFVVAVAGEVDVSNANELRRALEEASEAGKPTIEVDLAQTSYIDSTGIGVLVGAAHRAADAGASFCVLHPQRNVARVLTMLGVSDELGVRA
ncbi:MAG: STAS domain-containing protein [Coriobacteriales bacterium]|nr:STAS domain-containing protein [Coriobacteriales bacterium]